MLDKTASYNLIDAQPLNTPVFGGKYSYLKVEPNLIQVGILDKTIRNIKTASQKSAEMERDGDSPEFDLEAEIKSHPDSLFVKCFAIKADETNDNADHFPKSELIKATGTFIGVPVFTNHNNSDAEEARGKVIHAWWDEDRNGIMIIARVDAEAYPKLARGIKEEYIAGTSMGCQVQYSVCSICHKKAANQSEYCSHILNRKTRKISEKNVYCQYHKSGGEEDTCPVCGCEKGETKKFSADNKDVYEINYGIKFIENSFVVNPACHSCGVTEVIDPQEFLKKVASLNIWIPRLLKSASQHNLVCTDQGCIKYAGQKELETLTQALKLVTSVGHSMLKQTDQIDLEFLADLIKVAADLQATIDELTQQGYGRLPSPPPGMDESQPDQTQAPAPSQPEQGQSGQLQPLNPIPGGSSKIQTGPAGSSGTVTGPMASAKKLTITKLAFTLDKTPDKVLRIRKILQNNRCKNLKIGRQKS